MEHHVLPQKPTNAVVKVPYVCLDSESGDPYDGGTFLDYPTRVNSSLVNARGSDGAGTMNRLRQRRYYSDSKKSQESFYQTWLFFGLLHAFLGPLYKYGDFIERVDECLYVTTAKLIQKMSEAWVMRSQSWSSEEKAGQWQGAANCLEVARLVLSGCRADFDWRVRLSMTSVAELFGSATSAAFMSAGLKVMVAAPSAYFSVFPGEITRMDMEKAGWCKSEIASISGRFKSLQTLMFLSRLDRSWPKKEHSRCTDELCLSYQIDLKNYQTGHRSDCSGCQPSDPIDDLTRKVLETPSIPLLLITGNAQKVNIQIISSSADTEYIAISHVWADGLGNPFECSVPSCQLHYISTLASRLRAKVSGTLADSNNKPALVWLDTMCCPVRPIIHKRAAISRMHYTYSHATHVLVLEKSLQGQTFSSLPPIEALLRIFNSGWISRLWTLQEGVLPKRLWVQFADTQVELDKLHEDQIRTRHLDIRIKCIVEDLHEFWRGMRLMSYQGDIDRTSMNTIGQRLLNLDNALIYRSVTVPSDEALCISTLLEIGTKIFDDIPETVEARMCKIWQVLSEKYGLPQEMLALNYPRLTTPGFRWAPASLLTAGSEYRVKRWNCPIMGTVTEQGFLVQYPGFRVSFKPRALDIHVQPNVANSALNRPIAFHVGKERYLFIEKKGCVEARHSFVKLHLHKDLLDKDLAIFYIPSIDTHHTTSAEGTGPTKMTEAFLVAIEPGAGPRFSIKCEIMCPGYISGRQPFGLVYDHIERIIECTFPKHRSPKVVDRDKRKISRWSFGQLQRHAPRPPSDALDEAERFSMPYDVEPLGRGTDEIDVNPEGMAQLPDAFGLGVPQHGPDEELLYVYADAALRENPALYEAMKLIGSSEDYEILGRMLASLTQVRMRYEGSGKRLVVREVEGEGAGGEGAAMTKGEVSWCIT